MPEHNPYAPSSASLAASGTASPGSEGSIWRHQKILVMAPGSELPHRCVKCNDVAAEPTKVRKIYWHAPGWYLLILVNIILYAIVAAFVRKRALVAPGLCQTHRKNRLLRLTAAWLFFALGFGVTLLGFTGMNNAGLGAAGILLMLLSLIFVIIAGRILSAKKIDSNLVLLRGCKEPFLASLPPLP